MEHLLTPYGAVLEIPAASVLVIAPHPDDEVLGCGGAIIRHIQSRTQVRVVVVTDGALGAEAGEAGQRKDESRRAAAILGYGEPEFWDLADQGLAYGEPLVERIAAAIGGADLVYAPSPLEMHPDHRALAMAAAEAVRRRGRGVRIAFYEVGVPLRPNTLLDISGVKAGKQAAARCFGSQLVRQPYDEHMAALNRFRTYTLPPTVTAAEAYAVVDAAELAADPLRLYQPEHARQRDLGLAVDPRDLPPVSVIIRSMGRPELQEALDSVALQTYPNLEVVLVDALGGGGVPTDRCGRHPLRQVGQGARLGRSRAANLGLDASSGAFVIFLDDDDLIFPDHVARLVAAVRRRPGVRAAYAGVRVEREGVAVDSYDAAFDPAMLMAWNHLPIHAVLFHRSLLAEGCRFDESLDVYEDWDFWLQVCRHTPLERVAGVSAVYRAGLGCSGLGDSGADRHLAVRERLRAKWLPRLGHAGFEALVSEFRTRSAAAEREIARREFDMRTLGEHTAALEQALAAVRNSTSWRLTAPLRVLARMLGRRSPA